MENYRNNRQGCAQRSCGCPTNDCMAERRQEPMEKSCGCNEKSMYQGLDKLPLAMGYVPHQTFGQTFDLCKGLQYGTIFPELFKPFCGKGGGGCK